MHSTGVEDNGQVTGLPPDDLASSLGVLDSMARDLRASTQLTQYLEGTGGGGRRGALVAVKSQAEAGVSYSDVRIAGAAELPRVSRVRGPRCDGCEVFHATALCSRHA